MLTGLEDLGNAMTTNEAYLAASTGDVIRTRSIVRVMEPSPWSGRAILGIKRTSLKLRPSPHADTDAHVEEIVDPHANKDDAAPGDGQPGEPPKFYSSEIELI